MSLHKKPYLFILLSVHVTTSAFVYSVVTPSVATQSDLPRTICLWNEQLNIGKVLGKEIKCSVNGTFFFSNFKKIILK